MVSAMRMSRLCSLSVWTGSAISLLPRFAKALSLPGEGQAAPYITRSADRRRPPSGGLDRSAAGDGEDLRPQLGEAKARLAAGRQDLRMRGAVPACDRLGIRNRAGDSRRLELVGLGQHELIRDGRRIEVLHGLAVGVLHTVTGVDQKADALQGRPAAQIRRGEI